MADRIICPVHGMPDCSPLLNGCTVVTWAHNLVAEAKSQAAQEQREVDLAMHHAYRPEVVAEVAVYLGDESDWEGIATWCAGTINSAPDGTPSGEYVSWIDIPDVGKAFDRTWIVQRHDRSFALRTEVEGPSEQSVETLKREGAEGVIGLLELLSLDYVRQAQRREESRAGGSR